MKRFPILLIFFTMFYFFEINGQTRITPKVSPNSNSDFSNVGKLINIAISEVTDPADIPDAKYIELYNFTASDVNLTSWQIRMYADGSTSSTDFNLSGTIKAGETKLIAYNESTFIASYGVSPDLSSVVISGDGNDVYELYDGSSVVDIYGVVGVNGNGQPWEYTNSKAVRKNSVTAPIVAWDPDEWNIISSCNTPRMTPELHPVSAWNGDAKSNDWTAEGNWDNGTTGLGISAHLPSGLSNYPTISASATIDNLRMGNGATLLGGQHLTISGTVNIQNYISGYTGNDNGWNIITAPVSGMAIPGSDWVPVSGEDDFFFYYETNDVYLNYLAPGNPPTVFDYFDIGQGYLVGYHEDNDGIKNLFGALNTASEYTYNMSYGNTNWNFIGNPYPSKLSGGILNNASSMKTLDPSDGSYIDFTGSYLDICQGFVLYAETEGASITANYSYQTHGSSKKEGGKSSKIILTVSNGETFVNTCLNVKEHASSNFEWQNDSRYLEPISGLPHLCTFTTDNIKVSTNSFKLPEGSIVFPLYFSVFENGMVTFSLDDLTGASGLENIILEDQTENVFTSLSEGDSYTFYASTQDDPLRFKLHLNATGGINEFVNHDWFDIYSSGKNIYLNCNEKNNAIVNIFNLNGQLLSSKQLSINCLTVFETGLNKGLYIVKAILKETNVSKKVFIN